MSKLVPVTGGVPLNESGPIKTTLINLVESPVKSFQKAIILVALVFIFQCLMFSAILIN